MSPPDPLAAFSRPTRDWFAAVFPGATDVQARGWTPISENQHALLVAPTGSGKTLAAFLWAIDRTAREAADAQPGVRVLYISPLKALVHDVERNLRAPLTGIRHAAAASRTPIRPVEVAMRTGDTPARERQQMLKRPPDILVTTPESLYLMLGGKARAMFTRTHTVIIDEIHALAPTKRGAHLALSLERLAEGCTHAGQPEPQRVGLSATVRPLDDVSRFLGGDREVAVVDCAAPPNIDVEVVVPVPDMENIAPPALPAARQGAEDDGREERALDLEATGDDGWALEGGGPILGELYAREVGRPQRERGIWSALHPEILSRIRNATSTIVFVNSRGLCEKLAHRLNELAEEELVLAHHGSVSHQQREQIEDSLKRGAVKGIVATSSLELGIDMGAVDQVLLVESPGSVARGLQRIGRAGHHVGAQSVGRLFPKFRGDLLEAALIAGRMGEGVIEAIRIPRNALDVLAQQIVALVIDRPRKVEDVAALVRRAYNYRQLGDDALTATLEMLSGSFPSGDLSDLRPRLSWDRTTDELAARRGAEMVSRLNAGTIPDRGAYGVHLGEEGPRVGELDEEMVFETRNGDVILLGASSWRVENITRDRVIVTPAPGEPGRLPFWRGDGPGRPLELGRALGKLLREVSSRSLIESTEYLNKTLPMDAYAADNLAAYISEQKVHSTAVPTDRTVVIERFRDELGDWRVCILTPFGAQVHGPWAMAIQHLLGERAGFEVQVMYTDDGIVLRLADVDELPGLDVLLPDPDHLNEYVTEQLGDSALFSSLFRENAVRSLLMPRRNPKQRNPLWVQRQKAQTLLASVRRFSTFPVVLETYRQALSDVFDLAAAEQLLRSLRDREVRLVEVETDGASPFARSLVFAWTAAYIYEQDTPIAERRAQALTLDRDLLSELLGEASLRELIDGAVLDELEAELAQLDESRHARDADELHDALRRLGDLSQDELVARAEGDDALVESWLAALLESRRIVRTQIAGAPRFIAAEDAGLFRDALGCMLPPGLPDSFQASVDNALHALLARYARGRGPFLTAAPVARYGLEVKRVAGVLEHLERGGTLVHGEIRPSGTQPEWCDRDVLRRLKRRTLAKLRNTVAAVDARTLAAFLPQWQRPESAPDPLATLEAALVPLEGLALPFSLLTQAILPMRVPQASPAMLDMLAASGRIVWVGAGSLGAHDGRVALYTRTQVGALLDAQDGYEPQGAPHATLLAYLRERGASFLGDMEDAVRGEHAGLSGKDFQAVLWDLAWAGQVTNDTFAPLRALAGGPRSAGARRRGGSGFGRRGRSMGSSSSAIAGGRWSLTASLANSALNPTEKALARAEMLLERYGVVSREAAAAEHLPGGFASVYKVLKHMEDTGRVRRGYFVEGLSGAQFAYTAAVDQLRAARPDEAPSGDFTTEDVVILAAADPANPFGTLLGWPATAGGEKVKPKRVNGAYVMLVDGWPVLYLGANERDLMTFAWPSGDDRGALAACVAALPRVPRKQGRRGSRVIERIDGDDARASAVSGALKGAGYVHDYKGFVLTTPR